MNSKKVLSLDEVRELNEQARKNFEKDPLFYFDNMRSFAQVLGSTSIMDFRNTITDAIAIINSCIEFFSKENAKKWLHFESIDCDSVLETLTIDTMTNNIVRQITDEVIKSGVFDIKEIKAEVQKITDVATYYDSKDRILESLKALENWIYSLRDEAVRLSPRPIHTTSSKYGSRYYCSYCHSRLQGNFDQYCWCCGSQIYKRENEAYNPFYVFRNNNVGKLKKKLEKVNEELENESTTKEN